MVGPWIVSTVGEYVPAESVRELMAPLRNIRLTQKGEDREAEWLRQAGFEQIGCDRTYETMVFRAGSTACDTEGGCGFRQPDKFIELDFAGYNDHAKATQGHADMCTKWAERGADYVPQGDD